MSELPKAGPPCPPDGFYGEKKRAEKEPIYVISDTIRELFKKYRESGIVQFDLDRITLVEIEDDKFLVDFLVPPGSVLGRDTDEGCVSCSG